MKENELRMDNLSWSEKVMRVVVWMFIAFVLLGIVVGAVSKS
jgi:hypothetical protein